MLKENSLLCFTIRRLPIALKVGMRDSELEMVVLNPELRFDKHIKMLGRTFGANLIPFKKIRRCLPFSAAFKHAVICFLHLSYRGIDTFSLSSRHIQYDVSTSFSTVAS